MNELSKQCANNPKTANGIKKDVINRNSAKINGKVNRHRISKRIKIKKQWKHCISKKKNIHIHINSSFVLKKADQKQIRWSRHVNMYSNQNEMS